MVYMSALIVLVALTVAGGQSSPDAISPSSWSPYLTSVPSVPLAEKVQSALREHLSILVEGDDAIYVNLYEFRSVTGTARDRILRLRDAYEALWDGMLHTAVGGA